MSGANKNLQFIRVLTLYRRLPRSPESYISIDELENCLHFGKRKTLQRDLELLNKCLATGKIEKIASMGRTPAQYRLSDNAIIEQFSAEFALSLIMANSFLEQHLPSHVYNKMSGLFQSAEKQLEKHTHLKEWNDRIRFVYDGYCQNKYELAPGYMIELLYQAMLDNHSWVKIQYQREYDNDILEYVIRPQGMINRGRKQFILAHKIENQNSVLRNFCLHRIRDVQPAKEKLCVGIDSFEIYQAINNQEHEWALFDRETLTVKLRCEETLYAILEESELGNIIKLGDVGITGYFYVITEVMITETVLNWLVERAHQVRVMYPEKLVKEVKKRIQLAIDLYADNDFDDDILLEDDGYLQVEDDADEISDENSILLTSKITKSARAYLNKARVSVINMQEEDDQDDLQF